MARVARRKDAPAEIGETSAPTNPPPAGHNKPPPAANLALTPEEWSEWMAHVFEGAIARKEELLESFARFKAGYDLKPGAEGEPPIGIEKWSDDIQGRAGDLRSKITALIRQAESLHEIEKAPVLAASRAIDGFLNNFRQDLIARDSKGKLLAGAQQPINFILSRQNLYAWYLEKQSRAAAQAEADRAKLAAEQAAEQAKTLEPEALQKAAEADQQAQTAQAQADAKPAEHSRVHGPLGSVTSLRSRWAFHPESSDIFELAKAVIAGEVPRTYLAFNEVRIRLAITSEQIHAIPGCDIREETSV